ncbi:hypothetical protein BFJ71_g16745 [Fusarium oxysporum]|nr:hypothetical protein BFJ71_g16745 [Fusarium oxysporum]
MHFSSAFIASLLAATSVLAAIPVTIFDFPHGRGGFITLNLQPGVCKTLENDWKNRISSFSKPRGRTCRIYDKISCQGESRTYDGDQALICSLNKELANDVNSIKCW